MVAASTEKNCMQNGEWWSKCMSWLSKPGTPSDITLALWSSNMVAVVVRQHIWQVQHQMKSQANRNMIQGEMQPASNSCSAFEWCPGFSQSDPFPQKKEEQMHSNTLPLLKNKSNSLWQSTYKCKQVSEHSVTSSNIVPMIRRVSMLLSMLPKYSWIWDKSGNTLNTHQYTANWNNWNLTPARGRIC